MLDRVQFHVSLLWNMALKTRVRHWAHWVRPHIVLGALPLSRYLPEIFTEFQFTRLLSILQPHEYAYVPIDALEEKGVKKRLWIRCTDFTGLPDTSEFLAALDFIEDTKRCGECVYVHCKAGRSRSAMLVLGHLMKSENISFEEALAELKRIRPHVEIDREKSHFLKKFNKELGC